MKKFAFLFVLLFVAISSLQAQPNSATVVTGGTIGIDPSTGYFYWMPFQSNTWHHAIDTLQGTTGGWGWWTRNAAPHTNYTALTNTTDTVAVGYLIPTVTSGRFGYLIRGSGAHVGYLVPATSTDTLAFLYGGFGGASVDSVVSSTSGHFTQGLKVDALATFGTISGVTQIPSNGTDSTQLSITGITTSMVPICSYVIKGAGVNTKPDSIPMAAVNTNGKLTLTGKAGYYVGWWIPSK